MSKKIKRIIRNNVALADFWDSLISHKLKKRIVLLWYVKKLSKIDSIQNFDSFRDTIKKLFSNNFDYYINQNRYDATRYYGYYNEILRYSGYRRKKYPIITGIEHGIRFGNTHWDYKDYNTCYLCQGENRINEITDLNPYMPVCPVGPYIFYSDQYYSVDCINKLKSEYGKTLLVFMGHTTEWEQENEGNNVIDIVYNRYAAEYKTILVCLYWRDVVSKEGEEFRRRGAKLVSAGFRQDPNFIKRLKTIISLADVVVANDIGTNIGFALCLGKPFFLIGKCKTNPDDNTYSENYKLFYKAFSLTEGEQWTSEQLLLQEHLYKSFWGKDYILSHDEMYWLFSLTDKVLVHSFLDPYIFHKTIKDEKKLEKILNNKEKEILKKIIKTKI